MKDIRFTLNGTPVSFSEPDRTLLWVLRSDFQLTGTKYSCGEGLCGACTVLVDGKAERSCQLIVGDVDGKSVTTIEGLAQGEKLHPVQQAFVDFDALQCGFCTPGMILNAVSLLHENPHPSEQDIIAGMEDNLCRCGAHGQIIQAIQDAAQKMGGER